jgi:hypothetical protein
VSACGPSQLRSKLFKKEHLCKKCFPTLGCLLSEPFKIFVRCVHSPHFNNMHYNTYAVKFMRSRSLTLTLSLTLRGVQLKH